MREFAPQKIVGRRKHLKISRTALVEKAGISRSYLHDIEIGRSTPSARVVGSIAGALNVKESYFFITCVR